MKIQGRLKSKMNKKSIVNNFRKGKIGVFPTDTAYGIGCRIDDLRSVARVFKIRNRPKEKAVLILASNIEMARKYVEYIPKDVEQKLLAKYWPGGLTVIFRCKKDKVADIVRANGETIAIRIPDHSELKSIIEEINVPIIAPSANLSGEQTPLALNEVSQKITSKVDFVMGGSCTIRGVSTLIDVTKKPWQVIREGVVDVRI